MRNKIVLTVGDSISWGQGLTESQKFSSLVCEHLRGLRPAFRWSSALRAHSGAIIGRSFDRAEEAIDPEVPVDAPTILQQVASYRSACPSPEDVALILVNGGINDVGLNSILAPIDGMAELSARVSRYCFDDFKFLLETCRDAFPAARIIVNGYYPIFTEASAAVLLPVLTSAFGAVIPILPAVASVTLSLPPSLVGTVALPLLPPTMAKLVVQRCMAFAVVSSECMQRAALAVGQQPAIDGGRRYVRFVSPAYGSENAVFAQDSYLWGLRLSMDPTEPFLPMDSVYRERIPACHAARSADRIGDYGRCKLASLGHPNVVGAQVYAQGINKALDEWLAEGWLTSGASDCSWLSLLSY